MRPARAARPDLALAPPRPPARGTLHADRLLWVAAFGLSGLEAFLALFVQSANPDLFPGSDKILHAIVAATASGLFLLAAVWRPGRGRGRFLRAAPVIAAAVITGGGLVEVLQRVLRTGDAELKDWLADIVGVAIALLVHGGMRARAAARARGKGSGP